MQVYYLLIGVYGIFFTILAWYRFKYAVGILVVSLPTYILRFSVGPLPSTVLEVTWAIIFLVWCIKYLRDDLPLIKNDIKEHRTFFILLGLFFIASVLGVFTSDMVLKSAGQWRAYFLEPMVLFFILLGRRKEISVDTTVWFLALSTVSISVYGIFQKFTGWGIATPQWTNPDTRRVTAFFSSPNAVGLYVAPIVLMMLIFICNKVVRKDSEHLTKERLNFFIKKYQTIGLGVIVVLSLGAILFTKSEGTIVALGAGVLATLFFLGFKKTALASLAIILVVCVSVPWLRGAVLFQDKPGQNRLTLWVYSWNYLTASPKNFVLGAGVRQFFRKIQKPYYDPKKMERLIYPHNIFLNFWTETGLLGMVSIGGILGYLLYRGVKLCGSDRWYGAGLLGVVVVLVVHGLVDVPYFKNDLAMQFWIIASLFFMSKNDYKDYM